jgi:hypothetical protein
MADAKGVGDDARALAQFGPELRLESRVDAGPQEQRDHRGRRDVHGEEVTLDEGDFVRDAMLDRGLARDLDQRGIELDPDAASAVLLRRADQNPSIAGAEVVDDVLGVHAGELQHGVDDRRRRRRETDVKRPGRRLLRVDVDAAGWSRQESKEEGKEV